MTAHSTHHRTLGALLAQRRGDLSYRQAADQVSDVRMAEAIGALQWVAP